jgi:hypothetical protein
MGADDLAGVTRGSPGPEIPIGDPEAEITRHGDRGDRQLQIATGLTAHCAALGFGARLYSDAIDTALGLSGTSWSNQTMLLIGAPAPAPSTSPSYPAGEADHPYSCPGSSR